MSIIATHLVETAKLLQGEYVLAVTHDHRIISGECVATVYRAGECVCVIDTGTDEYWIPASRVGLTG